MRQCYDFLSLAVCVDFSDFLSISALRSLRSSSSPGSNGKPSAVRSFLYSRQGSPPAASMSSRIMAVVHLLSTSIVCVFPEAEFPLVACRVQEMEHPTHQK